jgi:hypothetical protein
LKSNNGTIAVGHALLEIARRYYKKLYSNKKTNSKSQQKLLQAITSLLNVNLKQDLEKPLELDCCFNKMKKNKSPGSR